MPHLCPVCGKSAMLKPSYPGGDSCCPSCGQLLWWCRQHLNEETHRLLEQMIFLGTPIESRDSMEQVELVMELEAELGVTISDVEARDIKTFADAIRYIQRHRPE